MKRVVCRADVRVGMTGLWLPTKIYIKKGVKGDTVENKCVSRISTEEESVSRVTMITMHCIHAINIQNKLIPILNTKQKYKQFTFIFQYMFYFSVLSLINKI